MSLKKSTNRRYQKSNALRKLYSKIKMLYAQIILILFYNKIKDLKFSIILSPGRTGTRSLGLLLNTIPNVLSRHEPRPSILDLSVASIKQTLSDQEIFKTFLNRRSLYFYEAYSRKQIYCESNYSLTFISNILIDKLRNTKAVFITRNPKNYVRSAFSKEFGAHNNNGAHRLFDERDKRTRITTSIFENYKDIHWDSLSRFEKVCWNFRLYHDHYLYLKNNGYPIKIFYFEDIFSNKVTFHELLKELGMSINEEQKQDLYDSFRKPINSSPNYLLGDFSDWSEKNKKDFRNIIGPLYSNFEFK